MYQITHQKLTSIYCDISYGKKSLQCWSQNHLNSQNQHKNSSKSSASLDGGDNDRGSVISWGDEIRPASAQANPINRMCTGALSRALVRLNGTSGTSDNGGELMRRQSSPVFRLSTSWLKRSSCSSRSNLFFECLHSRKWLGHRISSGGSDFEFWQSVCVISFGQRFAVWWNEITFCRKYFKNFQLNRFLNFHHQAEK